MSPSSGRCCPSGFCLYRDSRSSRKILRSGKPAWINRLALSGSTSKLKILVLGGRLDICSVTVCTVSKALLLRPSPRSSPRLFRNRPAPPQRKSTKKDSTVKIRPPRDQISQAVSSRGRVPKRFRYHSCPFRVSAIVDTRTRRYMFSRRLTPTNKKLMKMRNRENWKFGRFMKNENKVMMARKPVRYSSREMTPGSNIPVNGSLKKSSFQIPVSSRSG